MKRYGVCIALGAVILSTITIAQAARNVSTNEPIVLRLDTNFDHPTLVVFPETITGVGVFVNPSNFSLEYDGSLVIIQAMKAGITGRFFPVGSSGKPYTVTYKTQVPGDDIVYVVPEKAVATDTAAAAKVHSGPTTVSMVLRAMRQGVALPGQVTVDMPAPALNEQRVVLTGWQAIGVGRVVGLTLALSNATDQSLSIDLRYGSPVLGNMNGIISTSIWAMPPTYTVRAITADAEIFHPKGSVNVYIILEKR